MNPLSTLLSGSLTERVRTRLSEADRSALLVAAISGVVALLVVSPMFWLLWQAATVELSRAVELMFSARTGWITLNSLTLMVATTVFSILLGVPLAILTTRTDIPYPKLWTIIAALPLVIPSYIGAIAFVAVFGPGGEIDSLFGLTLPRVDGLAGAIFIITLYTYPYVFLTTRAALLSMDQSLVEAARTLNAGRIEAFRRVTFPQIRPGIAAGALLAGLYALSDFGTPAFMDVRVFTSTIYWEFGASIEYAALLALQLVAIVGVILVIEAGIGRDEDAHSGDNQAASLSLGAWKWPAMGFVSSIGIVTLVVPVAIFTSWLVRSQGDPVASLEFQWDFAFNSVYLALLAAIVACCFAVPVAYYSGRTNSLISRLFERATYVGFAVPGIVIGLALVFLGTRTLPSLYRQGVWLLVFGYVVRFLPQAVGTVRSSVLQVDDDVLEAARTLNAGRVETFRRVTLPLIAPGMVAGAVLVFLTTMKELPMTLMLQPVGMDTLVTIIWDAQRTLHYQYAAIPALLIILISGLTMVVLLRQEGGNVG